MSISSLTSSTFHEAQPTSNGNRHFSASWTEEKEKVILGPYEYLFNQPGKDLRTQMIDAFDTWLKVPEKSLAIITKVVGMLHTASLLYVSNRLDSTLIC